MMGRILILILFWALLVGCSRGSALENDRQWELRQDAVPAASAVYWDPSSLTQQDDIRGAWWKLSYDPPVQLEGQPIRAVIFFQEFNCATGTMHFRDYYYVRENGAVSPGQKSAEWLEIRSAHDRQRMQELCAANG